MGAWPFRLPLPPLGVLCPASPGQAEMCTPRGAMRWSAAALFRLYPLGGPHMPTAGSILVWRSAPRRGIDIPASQGVLHPKGTVTRTAPWTVGPPVSSCSWPWCGGEAGPGCTAWCEQSCIAFWAFAGCRSSDQLTGLVRWMCCGPLWDRSAYIMGFWREPASHG